MLDIICRIWYHKSYERGVSMAKTNQEELFRTVSRGYDKDQVQGYLRDMMENHACQQEELQELANAQEQAAAHAMAKLMALQQELGESLYDLQTLRKENERLQREKEDADKKVLLADKMLTNMRAEVAAVNSMKTEMEHSLSAALEQNCRLEKKLAQQPAAQGEDPGLRQQVERLRADLAALRGRNDELEAQMTAIRRKILDVAKARQARLGQKD